MLKFLLFVVFTVCIALVTCFGGNRVIGPGRWIVDNIQYCENPEQYIMVITAGRKKLNRTHDYFYLSSNLEREINLTHGIIIDVFKEVDGGYKMFQVYTDSSACDLVKKFAEENVKRALTMGGFDPPDCPLQPRNFEINNFVMDYTELPTTGMYGKYKSNVYLMYEGVKLGCVQLLLNFEDRTFDDDDDDNDDDS